ncbi:MAG: hypothetical protein IPP58_05800 [Holophagaceae bacterium]|uniref:Uncharacterized protein n=1 Tax=Candidatus Geothrix skivensis TaxID=2954439 RepID=A0A9D7SE91_9BACT|nr:hypothetical protein [Candidatus Geothrix skivensis]
MSTKQIKVHADGCTPDNLELMKYEDKVVFIQGGPKAPLTVHVDSQDLFGTSICSVGASASEATVYTPKAVGNYIISLKPAGARAEAKTVQVLCLAPAKAMGVGDSGSIKVTR